MADVEEEMYLENLDEFVNDEDKIVTYKWLSRTLSVSTNRAKQMLYKFINHQKKSRPDIKLNVTYLVGGQNQLNGEIVQRYVIAGNQDLQETKKQFSTLTCVHVYSIQKCKLKDSNPLYTVDYDIQQEHKHNTNRWNHIHCKAAEKLRDGRSRGTADDSERTQPQTHKLTNGFHDASTSGGTGGTTRTEGNRQQTSGKQKKGSKSGMDKFMSKVPATSKSTDPSENKSDSHKAEQSAQPSKKSGGSKAGSMKSFFAQRGTVTNKKPDGKDIKTDDTKTATNQNATNDSDTKAKREDTKVKQEDKPMKNEQKKRTVSSSEDEEDPLPKRTSNSVATSKEKKANKSKKKQETENKSSAKGTTSQKARRKFKAMINDSDDDDDDEEDVVKPKKKRKRMKEIPKEESSDEEPTTEDSPPSEKSPEIEQDSGSSTSIPNQQPQPAENAGSRRRKRTKVMRSKTYMNDEGFMVTEKVWESDSTDASDVDMEERQSPEAEHRPQAKQAKPDTKRAKNHKSVAATNKPTKQASLMSFFNKT